MAVFQLYKEQKIQAALNEVWDFISSPANLKRITPEYMGFDINSEVPEKMHPGMIISYTVTPILNFKLQWISEITHVKEGEFFVDEQRVGPYKMWHHQHKIKACEDGVIMTDLVTYQPPLGILGRIMNHFLIRKKLEEIFKFRKERLSEIFPGSV